MGAVSDRPLGLGTLLRWTGVSYEPWGWAPYHYGRWFYYGNNWCWWPGPVYVGYRPLWSPAFVFFVGFGHRSGFGFGSIGWYPVGPHDAFYPWYGRGFNRVNVVNITNIDVVNGLVAATFSRWQCADAILLFECKPGADQSACAGFHYQRICGGFWPRRQCRLAPWSGRA